MKKAKKKTSKKTAKKSKPAAKKATKKATKKAVKKTAKKVAKKVTKKVAKKVAKPVAKSTPPVAKEVKVEVTKAPVVREKPQQTTPNHTERPNHKDRNAGNRDQNEFVLTLSQGLAAKLKRLAGDEGVSPSDLAGELISEGVVLRAWEVIERKKTMRGDNQQNRHQGQKRNDNRNQRKGGFNKNRRNRNQNNSNSNNSSNNNSNQRGGNWMEDKASFMEYVRNQEKRRR